MSISRPKSRERIETISLCIIFMAMIVSPGPKAGSGLKLHSSSGRDSYPWVSPGPKAGSGLKQPNGVQPVVNSGISRPKSRERIETEKLSGQFSPTMVSPGPKAGSGLKRFRLVLIFLSGMYLPAQKPGAD